MSKPILISTDDFQRYMKDLRKRPVIENDVQINLFRKLKEKNLDRAERLKIHNQIIEGNLRFVVSVANKYQHQGLELVDLISEGNIGLINAIERYDVDSGNKFISYAVWWIRQAIMEAIYDNSRTIRVPTNVLQEQQRQKHLSINTIMDMEKYADNHDYLVNYEEMNTVPTCVDLNSPLNDENDTLLDIVPNTNALNPEDYTIANDKTADRVNLMLSVLDEREKLIVTQYYGLDGAEVGLDVIGNQLGCTKERVRQLKVKAVKKLRNESYELLQHI